MIPGLLLQNEWIRVVISGLMGCAPLWFLASSESTTMLTSGLCLALMMQLLGKESRVREFEATLPVDGGQLVRQRLQIQMLGILLIAAIAFVLMTLRLGKLWQPGILQIGAATTLASAYLLIFFQIRPREMRLPQWIHMLDLPVLFGVLLFVPPLAVLLVSSAALAILIPRTIQQTPKAYQLPTPWEGWPISWPRLTLTPAFAWKPVLRTMLSWDMLFGFYWLVMWSAEMPIFATLFLWMFLGRCFRASPWLFSLPVSRRQLFLTVTALFALTTAGSLALRNWMDFAPLRVEHGDKWVDRLPKDAPKPTGLPNVLPQMAHWHRVPGGGAAPEIRAPWGETARASTGRVLWIDLYNPYTVNPTNSRQFLDWQLARASMAVYGQAITVEEWRKFRAVPLSHQPRAMVLIFTVMWIWAFGYFVAFCWFRPRIGRWWARTITVGVPLVVILLLHWQTTFDHKDSFSNLALATLQESLPADFSALLALCVVVGAVVYWVAEREFSRWEASFEQARVGAEE